MTFPTLIEGSRWTANYHNTFVRGMFSANPPHIFTAQGDLPVATGAGAIGILPIGTNTQMIESRASEATGRKWVNAGTVPVGGIVLWNGDPASVPVGWAICDGTGGTPDLRDKFIIGSGTTYAIGATGGATTMNLLHSHDVSSTSSDGAHTHTQGSTGNESSHTHTRSGTTDGAVGSISNALPTGTVDDDWPMTHAISGSTGAGSAHSHTNPTTGSDGAHSHTTTGLNTDSQLSASQSKLPPYYALYYIRRMS